MKKLKYAGILILLLLCSNEVEAQWGVFSTFSSERLMFSDELHKIEGTDFSYQNKKSWALNVQLGGSYEVKNNLFMFGVQYAHWWLSKTQYMTNEHPLDPHSPPGHPSYLPPITTREDISQTDNLWEIFFRYGYSIKIGSKKMFNITPFVGWNQNIYVLFHLNNLNNFTYVGSASLGIRFNIKGVLINTTYNYNIGIENYSSISFGLGYVYTFKTKAERQAKK